MNRIIAWRSIYNDFEMQVNMENMQLKDYFENFFYNIRYKITWSLKINSLMWITIYRLYQLARATP